MVYDCARQRVVLFGGTSSGVQSNETWEWNGTAWQAIASASNPVARAGHAMSYDTARQRVVMFGGNNTGIGLLADTWEWSGMLWLPAISANFPPARSGHALAYDGLLARSILFGGNTGQNVAETWQWDGTNWTQITPLIGQPAPRTETALAYSADDQQLMFFGGDNGGGLPDTWIAGNSTTTYGAGCGSPTLGFVPGPTPPYVGQTATATITNASTPIAAVAIGLSREFFGPFPLPLPLSSYGMTGCDMWQSSDIVGLPVGVQMPSSLSFTVALPNVQGLVGRHLYGQAFAFAPMQNPLGVVASNGVDWLVCCPPLPPMTLVEDFLTSQQLDVTASAGQWFNGMGLFARIGGDARHGDFDISLATDTGEILNGQRGYELDCDHRVWRGAIYIGRTATTEGTIEMPGKRTIRRNSWPDDLVVTLKKARELRVQVVGLPADLPRSDLEIWLRDDVRERFAGPREMLQTEDTVSMPIPARGSYHLHLLVTHRERNGSRSSTVHIDPTAIEIGDNVDRTLQFVLDNAAIVRLRELVK